MKQPRLVFDEDIMPSDLEDCGHIEGDQQSPVLKAELKRLARRMRAGHLEPIHKKLEAIEVLQVAFKEQGDRAEDALSELAEVSTNVKELKIWHLEMEKIVSEIKGGFKAVKFLGYAIVLSIACTFSGTIWIVSKLSHML